MKKIIVAVLLIAMVAGGLFAQQRFSAGRFTATAQCPATDENFTGGSVTVVVTVNRTRITRIEVSEQTGNTAAFLTMVVNTLIPAIIEAQSTDIDVLAGATGTSVGVLAAVEDALGQARR